MKIIKLLLTILLFSTISYAKDLYRVVRVPSNDTLNVRIDAGIENLKIGELPYNATNIERFNCKRISNNRVWCKIQYKIGGAKLTGWVDSRYIEPLNEIQKDTKQLEQEIDKNTPTSWQDDYSDNEIDKIYKEVLNIGYEKDIFEENPDFEEMIKRSIREKEIDVSEYRRWNEETGVLLVNYMVYKILFIKEKGYSYDELKRKGFFKVDAGSMYKLLFGKYNKYNEEEALIVSKIYKKDIDTFDEIVTYYGSDNKDKLIRIIEENGPITKKEHEAYQRVGIDTIEELSFWKKERVKLSKIEKILKIFGETSRYEEEVTEKQREDTYKVIDYIAASSYVIDLQYWIDFIHRDDVAIKKYFLIRVLTKKMGLSTEDVDVLLKNKVFFIDGKFRDLSIKQLYRWYQKNKIEREAFKYLIKSMKRKQVLIVDNKASEQAMLEIIESKNNNVETDNSIGSVWQGDYVDNEETIKEDRMKEKIENAKLYQNNCGIPATPSIYASSSELRRHEKKVERFERCLSSVHDKNRKIFRELIEEVGGKKVDGGFNVFYQYTDSFKKLQARIEKIEASLNESADMYTTLVAKRKKEMDDAERWNSALQDLSNTLERMNRGESYNYMGY